MRYLTLALVLILGALPLAGQVTVTETWNSDLLVGTQAGSVYRVPQPEGAPKFLFNIGSPVAFVHGEGTTVYACAPGGQIIYRWTPDRSPALVRYVLNPAGSRVDSITSNSSGTASLVNVSTQGDYEDGSTTYLINWGGSSAIQLARQEDPTFVAEDRIALWGQRDWMETEEAEVFERRVVILDLSGTPVPGKFSKLPNVTEPARRRPWDPEAVPGLSLAPLNSVLWAPEGLDGVGTARGELGAYNFEGDGPNTISTVEYSSKIQGKDYSWSRRFLGALQCWAQSPTGKSVAIVLVKTAPTGDARTLVRLLDGRTGNTVREFPPPGSFDSYSTIRFGATDEILAVESDQVWAQWSSQRGRWVQTGPNNAFAVFPDASFLRNGPNGTIERTPPSGSGPAVQTYGPPASQTGGIVTLAVSPTGRSFLAVDEGGTAYFRDVATGAVLTSESADSDKLTTAFLSSLEAPGQGSTGRGSVPLVPPLREVQLSVRKR